MSIAAVTTAGSRTFGGNVVVEWNPSSTEASVLVKITVGSALAWERTFTPENTSQEVLGEGETWKLEGGTFTVEFSGDGKDGQLHAHSWLFSVENNQHNFTGLVGVW